MHLCTYLILLAAAEQTLADSYVTVSQGHADEADVHYTCADFARQATAHVEALAPVTARYTDRREPEPERLRPDGLTTTRGGPVGLLRDLQDLYQLVSLVDITWALVGQAAAGARDRELIDTVAGCHGQTTAQHAWLRSRMRAAAPQTLLVAT
ncbi:hypothetical protein [Actinocatenispora comari]|jgi:hypothetical protein|uniref:Uncharacterized protein n=1 Tax=Actinocatenispora comari TaxID=2807577 RepID=A0A8J4EJF2_9ACTN|nr:hypothetical protein [Actinocatenispora comari]GIL25838.1 hypothetical protein NUM_10920 [Actinocatenispora comari]